MASRGVNKTIIVGNLGQDPETRHTNDGKAVTNISVATSEVWKDKQTGQQQERSEWHRIVFFNKLAEIAGQYLKKGSKIYIEGSLRTRKWQDNNGQDRYTTEIVANELQMLDSKADAQNNAGDNNQGGSYNQNYNQPQQNQYNQPQQNAGNNNYGGMNNQAPQKAPEQNIPEIDIDDDEIPF